jgi:hypothetical protein
VIGGVGTAVAGSEAAGATKSATNAAIAQQQSALTQQQALNAPYNQLGQSAIPQLQSLLGITPAGTPSTPGAAPSASSAASLAALRGTPGYQFQQQEGTTNTLNTQNASGLLNSGNTLTGLSEFNQGLADTTFQQAVGNAQNTVNTGQAAATNQAANIGSAANNISNATIAQGNTLAGIDANTIAGITKSVGGAANNATTLNTLQGLNGGGGGAYNPYLTDVIQGQSANEVNNEFGSPALIAPS